MQVKAAQEQAEAAQAVASTATANASKQLQEMKAQVRCSVSFTTVQLFLSLLGLRISPNQTYRTRPLPSSTYNRRNQLNSICGAGDHHGGTLE